MAPVAKFFEATWFLWWLFAVVAIGRWCWITFIRPQDGDGEGYTPWRELYRMALLERDSNKISLRIEEAEGAILFELTSQLFRPHDLEWRDLHDAMNNLRAIRENADWQLGTESGTKDPLLARRKRRQHSWRSWGRIQ